MPKKNAFSGRRLTATLVWTVVAVAVTVYLCYHIFNGFDRALATDSAVRATETVIKNFDAFVLRDETVIESETARTYGLDNVFCDYLVPDGGYSKIDSPLVKVYPSNDAATVSRIREIDERVKLLEAAAVSLSAAGIGDTSALVNRSYAAIAENSARRDVISALENYSGLEEALVSLSFNAGSTASREASLSEAKAELSALKLERAELCASLGVPEIIKSTSTGNFYSGTDGYETVLSSSGAASLTLEDFAAMTARGREENSAAIGRFSSVYSWYLAVPADMDTAAFFTVGKKYPVTLTCNGGETLGVKLERVIRGETGADAVMLFLCDRMPDGLDARLVQISVKLAEYSGYRIQNGAISRKGGRDGVWILSRGEVTWRYVTVLYDTGIYSVVAPQPDEPSEADPEYISLNDVYILSGNGLYEGMLVH